jgi:hypothetical protein
MNEIAKQVEPILQKIADFFDIFDLSFIVSGTATGCGLSFFAYKLYSVNIYKYLSELSGFQIFFCIISVYILGLISWIIGKFIRTKFYPNLYIDVHNRFLINNADNNELFTHYIQNIDISDKVKLEEKMSELYGMLWVKVRESTKSKASFSLLRRYWVQTATFEGLLFSVTLWNIIILFLIIKMEIPIILSSVIFVILCFIAKLLFNEAVRYKKYQLTELVQTYISQG